MAATVKVAMPAYQAVIYNWVMRTGTLRNDPEAAIAGNVRRPYATLNNKCMELRKVCASSISLPLFPSHFPAGRPVMQAHKVAELWSS